MNFTIQKQGCLFAQGHPSTAKSAFLHVLTIFDGIATKSVSQAYPDIIKMSANTVNSDKVCFPSLAGYHQNAREHCKYR